MMLARIAVLSSYCERPNTMIVRNVHLLTVCISMKKPENLIRRMKSIRCKNENHSYCFSQK